MPLARSSSSCSTLYDCSDGSSSDGDATPSDSRPSTPPQERLRRCHHCASHLSLSAELVFLDDAYCCASSRAQAAADDKAVASGESSKPRSSTARRLPLGRSSFPPVNYNSPLVLDLVRPVPPVNHKSPFVVDLVSPLSQAATSDTAALTAALNLGILAAELHTSTPAKRVNMAVAIETRQVTREVGLAMSPKSWHLVGLTSKV
jgi:hypothetical protein